MIELIVLNYLSDVLEVPVRMEIPEDPTERLVVLEKVGSGMSDHINTAMLAIQSIAPTLYEAAVLNERVKQAMANIISLDAVSRCALNSDYNYTDTASKRYRYQAVFDLTY